LRVPSFVFSGFVPTVYPETRDANGRPLGTVEPGDIRMLDEELGWPWVPVIPPGANETPSSDEERGEDESDPGPADVPESAPESAPGPVPAPPAVVPPAGPAFAVTTDQQ
jgi:hypothetical protein